MTSISTFFIFSSAKHDHIVPIIPIVAAITVALINPDFNSFDIFLPKFPLEICPVPSPLIVLEHA